MSAGWIAAALVALAGCDNLLLPRFLGIANLPATVAGLVVIAGLCAGLVRTATATATVPAGRLLACLALGIAVMLLGGQGHLFYANIDWQVRDAVLADMIRAPWPFAYVGHGAPAILRAPVAMYLLPALAGKAAGLAVAQWTMLAQDGLALGALLALGSLLAPDRRGRIILLVVACGFGGMDALGAVLTRHVQLWPISSNIQSWGPSVFSSAIASAFWVPQHAISGWLGAVFFLLWQRRILPLWGLLSIVPLAALWSPLGALGTMPFAALAGLTALARREVRVADVLLPAAASAVALLPLLYLSADAGTVGLHRVPLTMLEYSLFEIVEVVPCLAIVGIAMRGGGFGRGTFAVVLACLAAAPLIGIGESTDFAMRATIPALAILSVLVAEAMAYATGAGAAAPRTKAWSAALVAVLLVGAVTPLHEIARAIAFRPTPQPLCDVSKAWDQSFGKYGKETYFARLSALPARIRPAGAAPLPPMEPTPCWRRPWRIARFPG